MSYENIKSVILTLLVLISVILTWNLWTYQPNFETMENIETVQEVSLSTVKEAKKIIKPDRIFIHQKDKHFGTNNPGEIDSIIREISKWNFQDIKDISSEIKSLPNFSNQNGVVEILFPDEVPIKIYNQVIKVKNKNDHKIQFDRIAIDVLDVTKEEGSVYFLSYEDKRVFKTEIPASFILNFKSKFYNEVGINEQFGRYSTEIHRNDIIYLSEEETSMPILKYVIDEYPSEKFRDALFNDPSTVQKNPIQGGEEYTDSTTLMRVNKKSHTISFRNLADDKEQSKDTVSYLQRSIEFVNNHGGWTDNYRFVQGSESDGYVLFRIYEDGFPVFSEEGTSEILQLWGDHEINHYFRNTFSLDLKTITTEKKLVSGREAYEYLTLTEKFKPELLQDLLIGYKMSKDTQDRLVQLEPFWYYRYNDEWKQISTDDQGGLKRGLE